MLQDAIESRLGTMRARVLVINGDRDPIVSGEWARDLSVLSDRVDYTDAQLLAIKSFGVKSFSETLTPESTFHQRIGIRFVLWSSPAILAIVNTMVNGMRRSAVKAFRAALAGAAQDDKAMAARVKSYMNQWPVDLVASTIDVTSPTIKSLLNRLTPRVAFYFNILGISNRVSGIVSGDNPDIARAHEVVAAFRALNSDEYQDTYLTMQGRNFTTDYFGSSRNLFELGQNLRNAESNRAASS